MEKLHAGDDIIFATRAGGAAFVVRVSRATGMHGARPLPPNMRQLVADVISGFRIAQPIFTTKGAIAVGLIAGETEFGHFDYKTGARAPSRLSADSISPISVPKTGEPMLCCNCEVTFSGYLGASDGGLVMRGYRLWRLAVGFVPLVPLSNAVPARALPAGSYQQGCTQAAAHGTVLVAYCNDVAGVPQATALADFATCPGDIFNTDGKLFCARGAEPPGGTYRASCDQIAVDGDDLRAVCRATAGYRVAARLRGYRHCKQAVDNVDGSLVCRAAAAEAEIAARVAP